LENREERLACPLACFYNNGSCVEFNSSYRVWFRMVLRKGEGNASI